MTWYLVQPRDRIIIKGYGLLFFAKNMGKNIGKNISKNVSGKYSQKCLDNAKQTAIYALKTSSERVIQKTAEAIGDLIGNKITKISKTSQRNNSELFTYEHDKEILKEKLEESKKLLIIWH